MLSTVTIKQVTTTDTKQVVAFLVKMRSQLFPMLNKDVLSPDLANFEMHYLYKEKTAFFAALSPTNEVIGTICVYPYDRRFSHLNDFYPENTAEIVKCYVDEKYRRCGIGKQLFQQALSFSQGTYDVLSLHTHPFLPGGFAFWQSRGFHTRFTEQDGVWDTIFMDMNLLPTS